MYTLTPEIFVLFSKREIRVVSVRAKSLKALVIIHTQNKERNSRQVTVNGLIVDLEFGEVVKLTIGLGFVGDRTGRAVI